MEGGFHDAAGLDLAADLDAELGADGGVRGGHVGERDGALDRGTVRPRRDEAGRAAVFDHRITVARTFSIASRPRKSPLPDLTIQPRPTSRGFVVWSMSLP